MPVERPRRFPAPWTVEEKDACFIVRDHNKKGVGVLLFRG